MLTIAGVQVAQGDRLYVMRASAFGTVVELRSNVAIVRVKRDGGDRDFVVQQGGLISGHRDVFWHAPIWLDLPKGEIANLAKVQLLVDTLRGVL